MKEIALTETMFCDAVMPVVETAVPPPRSLTLGIAHLRNGKMNTSWLVRETSQLHGLAVAADMGCRPSDLRDMSGDRVYTQIECCVLTGDLADFGEDDDVTLDLAILPREETGWRSLSVLRSLTGSEIKVELVSTFTKRHPKSGLFVPAVMPEPQLGKRDDPAAQRANLLASRACAWRAAADLGDTPVTCRVQICAPIHMNGCGCVDAAALLDCVEQVEHLALSRAQRALPISRREIHISGALEDGEILAVQSNPYRTEGDNSVLIAAKSVLRRQSDQAIVAVCETLRPEI